MTFLTPAMDRAGFVNFWFYVPKFAEVVVIQKLHQHVCLTLCYLVSLLKVSRTKRFKFAHIVDFSYQKHDVQGYLLQNSNLECIV